MKILNIFSKNNVASDTFKEVSEFMETSDFEKQVRNLIKSLKIQEGFLMKSEILVIDYSESTTEESLFSENSWLNLVDFLKTQLKANMFDKVYYQTGTKKGQLKSYKLLKPLSEFKNIEKQKLKVARIYERLTRIRTEYNQQALHSLVLERKPSSIVIEDLAVRNLMKNRHLSKAISKAQWYKSRLYLENLCKKLGIELRLADRFYSSSKLCSDCGFKYKDLKLSERFWTCSNCGSEHDRDVNAAINLGQCKQYTVLTAV